MTYSVQKVDLFGVQYAVVDYEIATSVIMESAASKKRCGVSALAVHGLIESYNNADLRQLVNEIDLVVPDGQGVRWAMNALFNTQLKDRVYGPDLTIKVLEQCNILGFSIFLFGSKQSTLEKLSKNINLRFPNVKIAGMQADRFREATLEEDKADIALIKSLQPNLVLVGRGCPRQELWVGHHLDSIPAPMMAVGAAFDFLAGTLSQAPAWMQRSGLEWFYRLCMEPRRLWKRFLFTNSQFLWLFGKAIILKTLHNKKSL
jgi:exopolysaccharide biosynthesis WecB/TagA/CpsF family protein